jgi:hypothetical protein
MAAAKVKAQAADLLSHLEENLLKMVKLAVAKVTNPLKK